MSIAESSRVTEPTVKAHVALWLANRGATELVISVDGAEPNPTTVVDILEVAGYSRHAAAKDPSWTGIYTATNQQDIRVTSLAGPDIQAAMPGGTRLVGECKGQPTESGVKAGLDLTGFYTALGQLIVAAGGVSPLPEFLLLGFPRTKRFEGFAQKLVGNELLTDRGLEIVLVDNGGVVASV